MAAAGLAVLHKAERLVKGATMKATDEELAEVRVRLARGSRSRRRGTDTWLQNTRGRWRVAEVAEIVLAWRRCLMVLTLVSTPSMPALAFSTASPAAGEAGAPQKRKRRRRPLPCVPLPCVCVLESGCGKAPSIQRARPVRRRR